MFDQKDPRSSLNNQPKKKQTAVFSGPKFVEFPFEKADITKFGSKVWWSRGQNFYLSYSEAVEGETFVREKQVDEFVIILPDKNTKVKVSAGDEEKVLNGYGIIIVPSGYSEVKVLNGGAIVQLFTIKNQDLIGLAINEEHYKEKDPNVTEFQAWPESPEGEKIRYYSLDIPKEDNRFGRIFRCSTFMVNFLEPKFGPRDPSQLSPHSHDDFEQCSLALEGTYIHHLRWPWTPNKNKWREDVHKEISSPSMTIMPAGVIHTSEAVGTGVNQLVDIFCPPRIDFSKKEGWVLNDKDYPIYK